MTRLIFHITTAPEWAAARTVGSLSPPSLEAEGFVHCSSPTQVTRVADWFYRDVPDLVLLAIDPTRLVSPVRWEPSADVLAGDFPHVYGPITVEAERGERVGEAHARYRLIVSTTAAGLSPPSRSMVTR
ncbi:MAG: DUF952 domain-containing protein, partial [Actinomycetota bacterium]